MHWSRLGPAAAGHPFSSLLALVIAALAPAALLAADATVAGIVVDPSGQAVPRAYIRALDPASREIATTFANEAGQFRLTVPSAECRIAASLTGFEPSTVPCSAQSLRVVLAVAPIRETVVVTATRTEAPAGQVGASVTAFTAADLASRQTPFVADLLRASPGVVLNRAGGLGTVTVELLLIVWVLVVRYSKCPHADTNRQCYVKGPPQATLV